MPIHEIGYRHWEGATRGPLVRWLAITRRGVGLAFRNKLLRKVFIAVYAPVLYFAPLFLAIGFATQPGVGEGAMGNFWTERVEDFFGHEAMARIAAEPLVARQAAWSLGFFYYFSFIAPFAAFLVIAFVGPPLISRDVRSRSFLLYFSKPITIWEYVLGKGGVLASYIVAVSLVPALLFYTVSILFAPSLGALFDTWTTAARIGVAGLAFAIPVSVLMLVLSSLVRDSRYATFAWIVLVVFGEMTYLIASQLNRFEEQGWIVLFSIRQSLVAIYAKIFDVNGQFDVLGRSRRMEMIAEVLPPDGSLGYAAFAVGVVTVVGALFVHRRIRGVLRV